MGGKVGGSGEAVGEGSTWAQQRPRLRGGRLLRGHGHGQGHGQVCPALNVPAASLETDWQTDGS